MKTKELFDSKIISPEKLKKSKPKSLRPMRSLMAVRSLKPKTVATAFEKVEMVAERN